MYIIWTVTFLTTIPIWVMCSRLFWAYYEELSDKQLAETESQLTQKPSSKEKSKPHTQLRSGEYWRLPSEDEDATDHSRLLLSQQDDPKERAICV